MAANLRELVSRRRNEVVHCKVWDYLDPAMNVLALATCLSLAAGMPPPPGKVEYDVKKGVVTFDHEAHVARRESCRTCHGDGPARKFELGKKKAHALCLGCHALGRAGPTGCTECHED